MSQNNCGSLQFILNPNETYTIGTQAESDIKLKVQTSVPECSMLKINSHGFTEFSSNGISRCLINKEPFRGTRYLIPGDIIDLLGRKFKYLNPSLTSEKIDILQRENRKLFCNEKLKEKVNRPTMFLRRNFEGTPILTSGFRTPPPRRISQYEEYGSRFMVEDAENQSITPLQNCERDPSHQNQSKNLFSNHQPTESSDDNHFSFDQNYQINVNFDEWPASPNTPTSKEWYPLTMDNQSSDILSIQNLPFDKHITTVNEDVSLILNDISDPFLEMPESGKEFTSNIFSSLQHSFTTPQKSEESEAHINSELILKDNVNTVQNTQRTGRAPKSFSRKRSRGDSSIAKQRKKPVNVKGKILKVKNKKKQSIMKKAPKQKRDKKGRFVKEAKTEVPILIENTVVSPLIAEPKRDRRSSFVIKKEVETEVLTPIEYTARSALIAKLKRDKKGRFAKKNKEACLLLKEEQEA